MSENVKLKISIDVKESLEQMDGMKNRSKNFASVFEWAKHELEKANAENFALGGLPSGGWAPLSPRYAAWKSVHFPGSPVMVQTGELFRSLTSLTNSAETITPTSASFGTTVEYAKFHQYGTRKMPARTIIFCPIEFADNVADKARDHILNDKGASIVRNIL
jgi:phage gpG-like protein